MNEEDKLRVAMRRAIDWTEVAIAISLCLWVGKCCTIDVLRELRGPINTPTEVNP